MNNKADFFLSSKILFAVVLVIFGSLAMMSVINARAQTLDQRQTLEHYPKVLRLMQSALNSPCLVSQNVQQNKNYQLESQAFIDVGKLNLLHNENADIPCLENHVMLYSIEFEDILNKKIWRIGLLEEPSWAERTLQLSLPVALNYNYTTIHPGMIKLSGFVGELPLMYSAIKQTCITKNDHSIQIDLKQEVTYNNAENRFCVKDECFFAYFSCKVNDFNIEKGNQLIFISYDDEVSVVS